MTDNDRHSNERRHRHHYSNAGALARLVLVGLLSLPALLLLAVAVPVVAILSAPAAYLLLSKKREELWLDEDEELTKTTSKPVRRRQRDDENSNKEEGRRRKRKHVIITGGSSGIGLAIAFESAAVRRVDRVTLLARDAKRLDDAKRAVEELCRASLGEGSAAPLPEIRALSVDVTDPDALRQAAENDIFCDRGGDVDDKDEDDEWSTYLFCCAGEPLPAYYQDVPAERYAQLVRTNQLGTIYTVRAFLPYMRRGTVCMCSSACGQVGVFGYSAYAPTKFALRGFAECLHVELLDRPVHVQVAYPPDTDTPGFEKENVAKPEETRLVSEAGGLCQPGAVAKIMYEKAVLSNPSPPFAVYFDFDGFLLSTLTAGFSPVTTFWDALAQLSPLTTLGRWIALFYLQDWYRIVRNCRSNRRRQNTGSGKDVVDDKNKTE